MKSVFLTIILFFSLNAWSQEQTQISPVNPDASAWRCSYAGRDRQGYERQVWGFWKPTKGEARRSASSQCSARGLMGCYMKFCMQRATLSELE